MGRADRTGEGGWPGLCGASPPKAGSPASPHLALRGTVIDSVLVDGTQVLHETVRAQGPAHLDREYREGVRPSGAWPPPFLIPSAALPGPDHGGRRYLDGTPTLVNSPSSRWR